MTTRVVGWVRSHVAEVGEELAENGEIGKGRGNSFGDTKPNGRENYATYTADGYEPLIPGTVDSRRRVGVPWRQEKCPRAGGTAGGVAPGECDYTPAHGETIPATGTVAPSGPPTNKEDTMEHEATLTVREKDRSRVHELIRSTRNTMEADYADAVRRGDMEADIETARRWLDEAHELVTATAGTDELTLTGSSTVLEEVALHMLREAIEQAKDGADLDPPEWQRIEAALEDAGWWRTAHEDLYDVELVK